MAYSPEKNAPNSEILRYDLGWNAINAMLRAGRSLSGRERNCCFLNAGDVGSTRFADISGAAGLDFADDGRVLALADWDYDGDVDFWIANRSGPQVRYLQNTLPRKNGSVAIRLEGTKSNRDAIGACVKVSVSRDGKIMTQTQTLKAGEGYLSQNSKWLHFGLGDAEQIERVEVRWPNGDLQSVEGLRPGTWNKIREGEDDGIAWTPPKFDSLQPTDFERKSISDKARIVLLNPIPLPSISYSNLDGTQLSATNPAKRARLINLWATWCQPCIQELAEWTHVAEKLDELGVDVVAINTDEPAADRGEKIKTLIEKLELPFSVGMGDQSLVSQFDTIQRSLLSRQRPLPLPSTFLIDKEGRLRVVYKGPVDAATLVEDAKLVNAERAEILSSAIPFEGRWLVPPGGSTPLHLTVKYIDNDLSTIAREYIEKLLAQRDSHPEYITASMTNLYAAMLLDGKEYERAREMFEMSVELDPTDRQARIELGSMLMRANRGAQAEPHYVELLRITPNDPELRYMLGISQLQQGKFQAASEAMKKSVELLPTTNGFWQLGTISIQLGDAKTAIESYEEAIKLMPERVKTANNLAWLLATSDDDSLRNGQRALEIAKQIVAARPQDAGALDTLAAAYAEVGEFEKAQQTLNSAIQIAQGTGQTKKIGRFEARLKLYQSQTAYRESLRSN